MKIENDGTGCSINFTCHYGNDCYLAEDEGFLHINVGGYTIARLDRNQVKDLIPHIQAFAETGTLEPSPLQGDKKRIEALIATTVRMNVRNYRYEQLLKQWRKYGQHSSDSKSSDELIHLTDELIRESALSVDGINAIEKARIEGNYYRRQCDKQVDEIANLEERIEALTRTINDACEHIESLENLAREWRHYYQIDALDDDSSHYAKHHEIFEKTAQLLGEEQTNDPAS